MILNEEIVSVDKNQVEKNQKSILVISDLHKRYDERKPNEVHALRGLDLTVKKGDMMAIMGPSGCGKTTLLNMIGHLDKRSSGKIGIDGIDTTTLSDSQMTAFRRDNIGFIFQLFNLFPFLSAVENVETPLLLRGVKAGVAREQAKMLLRELGIGDRLYHLPSELSGGQQQRVCIARALVTNPSLVIADEPTANLDSDTAMKIVKLMRDLNNNEKTTFIFSTHDQRLLNKVDRLVRLVDGMIMNEEEHP